MSSCLPFTTADVPSGEPSYFGNGMAVWLSAVYKRLSESWPESEEAAGRSLAVGAAEKLYCVELRGITGMCTVCTACNKTRE